MVGLYSTVRTMTTPGPVACLGIDPSSALLAQWSLPDSSDGALAFGRRLIEVASDSVRIVKPQIAYFERFGRDGYDALTRLIAEARDRGLRVIADVKRGDIGPSCDAYGAAWIGPSAPMPADALTVTPYLGLETLVPIFERAAAHDTYVFVVARSSNPEGRRIQRAGDPQVWVSVLDGIADWAAANNDRTVGAVVGATVPAELRIALERLPSALFLAPGIGKQGASVDDLRGDGLDLRRVLVSSSRGIAEHGPDPERLRSAVAELAGPARDG